MCTSIFELERRFDFEKEFRRLLDLLDNKIYGYNDKTYGTCYSFTFWEIVNRTFIDWPHRLTAINVLQYFEDIDLDFEKIYFFDNSQKLLILQFVESYIFWLAQNSSQKKHIIPSDSIDPYIVVLKNIKQIIEKLNYSININEDTLTVFFTKRDYDLDSVLSLIENEEDLRLSLLHYFDFRIENDVDEKRIILKKLADYLEPQRREYSSLDRKLTDDIFFMFNNFYIRHNNPKNITFSSNKEYIYWYDQLIKMIIHLIRTKEIKKYQKELNAFKSGQIN